MEKQNNRLMAGGFGGLTGSSLKWIAMITMFIDHFAHVYVTYDTDLYWLMRGTGRLAFPIYCFLLVEGFVHTKNYGRYVARMALFALLSEIPFDLALYGVPFYWGYQSVMVTMLIGLLGLGAYRWCVHRQMPIYGILAAISAMVVAWLADCDYNADGILLIFLLYLTVYRPVWRAVFLGLWCALFGGIEVWGALAVIPVALYNGKRGTESKAFQWFGYLFYPVHLLLLWLGKVM